MQNNTSTAPTPSALLMLETFRRGPLPDSASGPDALALALLHTIIFEGLYDFQFVDKWCDGFDELRDHVIDYSPEWAAPITWLDPDQIRQAARSYAMNKPGCIQWGCTWDQIGRASTTGSHAIALLRAVTGNIEVPGGDGMPGPALNFLTDEELEAAGIHQNTIRLSIGTEHIDDIIADLENGFAAV